MKEGKSYNWFQDLGKLARYQGMSFEAENASRWEYRMHIRCRGAEVGAPKMVEKRNNRQFFESVDQMSLYMKKLGRMGLPTSRVPANWLDFLSNEIEKPTMLLMSAEDLGRIAGKIEGVYREHNVIVIVVTKIGACVLLREALKVSTLDSE